MEESRNFMVQGEHADFFMSQELFDEILEEPVTWKHSVDSFFLNGDSRFGTMWLFVLTLEEYKGEQLFWARIKFKIEGPRWLYNWWTRRVSREVH